MTFTEGKYYSFRDSYADVIIFHICFNLESGEPILLSIRTNRLISKGLPERIEKREDLSELWQINGFKNYIPRGTVKWDGKILISDSYLETHLKTLLQDEENI